MANFFRNIFQSQDPDSLEQKYASLFKRFAPKKSQWEQTDIISDIVAGTEILLNEADPEGKKVMVFLMIQSLYSKQPLPHNLGYNFNSFLEKHFKKNMNFTEEELLHMVESIAAYFKNESYKFPFTHFLKQIVWMKEESGMTPSLQSALSRLKKIYEKEYEHIAQTKVQYKNSILLLEELTGEENDPILFGEEEDCGWAPDANSLLMNLPVQDRKAMMSLLLHGVCISGSSPNQKWHDACRQLAESIDSKLRKTVMTSLFNSFLTCTKSKLRATDEEIDEAVDELPESFFYGTWTRERRKATMKEQRYFSLVIHEKSQEVMRGLLWIVSSLGEVEYIPLIKDITFECFKKVPRQGPRFMKLGNACLYTLGNFPGVEGVRTLLILNQKIKQRNVKNIIEKEIIKASAKLGISPFELEDMAVSDFGFSLEGRLIREIGSYKGILQITDTGVEMRWQDDGGKDIKTMPKVLQEYSTDISKLKNIKKEVEMFLPVIKERLDKSYLQKRVFPFSKWKTRYLEQPLFRAISTRLIWKLHDGERYTAFFYREEKFINAEGKEISIDNIEASVELWHPLDSTTDEVLRWRNFIIDNAIVQPFKQAFREVYIITDAECTTDMYSNRFAAHILKQHQFNNLCILRGWNYKLQSYYWDQPDEGAYIHLSAWNLRAEYWVNARAMEEVNDAGVSLYVTTDQVRFYTLEPRQELHLRDIPTLVFSEIMRDVDLFVGVGSVGNDPNWSNNRNELQQAYWSVYSFGNLSEISKTRKAMLEKIIPKLKIASQCELKDKFLYVKGKKRTYKIHIGSGNILMEPNDEYLCIVSRPSKDPSLPYLPFERDQVLSLILSKAFLLADDTNIKDKSIVSQINSKR